MFVLWAVYGVVPTIHWVCLQQGGPIVGYMIPRIFVMYAMCGAAFFFYLTKVPERLIPGLVDTFGHSHQVCQTIMAEHLFCITKFLSSETICEATISTILDDIILFIGYNGAFVIVPYL